MNQREIYKAIILRLVRLTTCKNSRRFFMLLSRENHYKKLDGSSIDLVIYNETMPETPNQRTLYKITYKHGESKTSIQNKLNQLYLRVVSEYKIYLTHFSESREWNQIKIDVEQIAVCDYYDLRFNWEKSEEFCKLMNGENERIKKYLQYLYYEYQKKENDFIREAKGLERSRLMSYEEVIKYQPDNTDVQSAYEMKRSQGKIKTLRYKI